MNRLPGILIALALAVAVGGCSSNVKRESAPGATSSPRAAANSLAEVADERPVIAALGDSLTAGLGVDPKQNYPAQLQRKLDAAGYRYRVVNAGVSGDTSAQGLNRLSAVRSLRPVLVIVELGANDGLRGLPLEQTRSNLEEIIGTLQRDGAKVVLTGMEIPPNYGPEYTGQFRSLFRGLAKKYDVSLVPFFLEGVGGIADLNQEDGIHPTAQGYARVMENVWKVIERLLKPAR